MRSLITLPERSDLTRGLRRVRSMAASTQDYFAGPRARADATPGGWTVFAAIMLLVSGSFNIIWGLAAVLNDQVVRVGGQGVIVLDFTTWGWVHIVLGAIMLLVSWGLFSVAEWARWTAIVIATLDLVLQMTVITAFPLWALVVMTLNVIVIYQLTAHYTAAD